MYLFVYVLYYKDDEIKKNEMGGACGTYFAEGGGRRRNTYRV